VNDLIRSVAGEEWDRELERMRPRTCETCGTYRDDNEHDEPCRSCEWNDSRMTNWTPCTPKEA
jgi:rubrerythrin